MKGDLFQMPNYYNPYNLYPVGYANQMGYNTMPMQPPVMNQQSYAQPQQQDDMKWVEGELGAKMFQMPANWPVNKVIMLWDSTDTNIYLKSWGPMGIPNPIQTLHYTMEGQPGEQKLLNTPNGNVSGANSPVSVDMSQYVTKADFENMKNELMAAINGRTSAAYSGNNGQGSNQNGSSGVDNRNARNNGNRGGNL